MLTDAQPIRGKIEITFILPYERLKDIVHEVLDEHPYRDVIKMDVYLTDAHRPKAAQLRVSSDVVIARGITVPLLKQHGPRVPVIEMSVTGYDVIKAVGECVKRFNPGKVACVGAANMIEGVQGISVKEIMGIDFECYSLEREEDAEPLVRAVMGGGCGAIIGGLLVKRTADRLGFPCVLIESGKEAVRQVLNEAIRTVLVVRSEREQAERFKTIMEHSYEGIIAIDQDGLVTVFNRSAQKLTGRTAGDIIGHHIDTVLPDLGLSKALAGGREELGGLCKLNETLMAVNCIPILLDAAVLGAIATFQTATNIQEMEGQIRNKIHAKGLFAKYRFETIIGKSRAITDTIHTAREYSKVESNVLLIGETGTGKELFAQSIHNLSGRGGGPFVAVNCAAIPEQLLESELFGYAEGAFTGAVRGGKPGLFELAHKGTIFLDEISELSPALQGRLLRVLQEKEIMRLGADRIIPVDVRIISATNRNLKQMVDSGIFRRDLLYRLDVLRIFLPPLRRRKEDLPLLIEYFLRQKNYKFGKNLTVISPAALKTLTEYDWPGNIRELENICERLVILSAGAEAGPAEVQKALFEDDYFSDAVARTVPPAGDSPRKLRDSEMDAILAALAECGNNRTEAARLLGIHKATLWRKLKRHGIEL
ncbi:MAG: sigma 54-interacting transcriptional regulator [Negativicutes bacterium]|nr:sigma 54-interacting transcriptional regulator [Negativicutes bacterium]